MSEVKDFFNIIFFVVMGVLAVLSYLQAKKTLFSPIRTEVFKIQISEIKEVLTFFNKHSSVDFDQEFDLRNVLHLNVFRMHQRYVELFFNGELKVSDDALEHFRAMRRGALVSAEHISAIEIGSELVEREVKKERELNPAMKLAQWKEFKLGGIEYTKKYDEKMQDLAVLASSPLLPKKLTDLLYEFHSLMRENVVCIGRVVNECAQDLPSKYVTAEDNRKFNPDWIWNKFNYERGSSEEVSGKILKAINSHLKVNDLMG